MLPVSAGAGDDFYVTIKSRVWLIDCIILYVSDFTVTSGSQQNRPIE